MRRTTIMLPEYLKSQAVKHAQQIGISLGELIRESLTAYLDKSTKSSVREKDPFFADKNFWDGPVPKDSSVNFEKYLYEDEL